jgi:c-di-GMP-binding flagellar brake protein YcgR
MTETPPSTTPKLVRAGVRFERVPTADQAQLDRYVFGLMQRKARARPTAPGSERRLAPRVDIEPAEGLTVTLMPSRPLGALARRSDDAAAAPAARWQVRDLSTTGCAFMCPEGITAGQTVRVRLQTRDMALELSAKVIHVLPAA